MLPLFRNRSATEYGTIVAQNPADDHLALAVGELHDGQFLRVDRVLRRIEQILSQRSSAGRFLVSKRGHQVISLVPGLMAGTHDHAANPIGGGIADKIIS